MSKGSPQGGTWVRAFIWVTLTMSTDDSSSVPISGWISTGEFLEQVGTDHPAPRERAGGARTHHWGELLGEAINACKMPWESSIFSGLLQQGERMLKAVFQPSR